MQYACVMLQARLYSFNDNQTGLLQVNSMSIMHARLGIVYRLSLSLHATLMYICYEEKVQEREREREKNMQNMLSRSNITMFGMFIWCIAH